MKISAFAHLGDQLREHIKRPRVSAVYFLIRDDEIVYIGQSCDIEARLELHIVCRQARDRYYKDFDRAAWIAVPIGELDAVEGALIRALRPEYNGSAPAYCGRDNEILARFGIEPHEDEEQAARDFVTSLPGHAARVATGKSSAALRGTYREHQVSSSGKRARRAS